jgi:nicotinamide-nucleotide amidase
MVPKGAATIDPAGTAPGLVVPVAGGPTVIVMPGPPRELQAMWPQALATDEVRSVLDRAEPYGRETLRMFGIPESEIAQSLREIGGALDLEPLEITTCLRRGEIEIDVRHRPGAEEVARRLMDALAERHERFVFSRDGSTIDEQLAALLRDRRRIGLAESCTAGLLAARLAEPPGASEYLAGGVVAYSNEAKTELLGVPAELIEREGAVSPEVAEAMADGALSRFEASVGVGITGIAGPSGGTEEKPVGYVCVCVKLEGGPMITRNPVIPGDRVEIKDRSCTLAMHLIRRLLRGEEFPL